MSAKDFLYSRGVSRLCHFTKISSLTNILSNTNGIVASSNLSDKSYINDHERLDGNEDYVCCSVQYPNWWYYNQVEKHNKNSVFNKWAVIFIDLSILDYTQCKFCPCNAAKKYGYYIFDDEKRINELYSLTTVTNQTRSDMMLSCCPTDDQAEIQIKGNIPLSFISGIAVGSDETAKIVFSILKTYDLHIQVIKCPEIFDIKCSKLVRQGRAPTEDIVNY